MLVELVASVAGATAGARVAMNGLRRRPATKGQEASSTRDEGANRGSPSSAFRKADDRNVYAFRGFHVVLVSDMCLVLPIWLPIDFNLVLPIWLPID